MSTPNVPQQELDDRIQKFAEACAISKEVVLEKLQGLIKTDSQQKNDPQFWLSFLENEEDLPMTDLLTAFADSGLTGKSNVRRGVKFLRGQYERGSVSETLSGMVKALTETLRPQEQWSDEELLTKYSETEPGIARILKDRSRGYPFVVFNSDGSVNIKASLSMLRVAKRQVTNEYHRFPDIGLVKLFRAGIFPSRKTEACPFAPNEGLVDGYCAKTDTQWSGISQDARILMHCLWKQENGQISGLEMKRLNDEARKLTIEELRDKYARAYMLQKELEEKDQLPRLMLGEESRVLRSKYIDTGFGG
jgi:hypothetical protein